MGQAFFTVGVNLLTARFASFECLTALIFDVELDIFLFNSKPASLRALHQSVTTTGNFVFHSWLVCTNITATFVEAFEFKIVQVLLNKSMHLSELYSFVTLTFLGARIVLFSPRGNAVATEQRLAPRALRWIQHDHSTNRTNKEVSSFSHLLVLFDKVGDV